ncbi:hypothetical protein CHH83_11865 [Bacillus sp. 7586-K]|nr:hypothetical protein CHH83_11865 [Bacillus sp. 7586-K]
MYIVVIFLSHFWVNRFSPYLHIKSIADFFIFRNIKNAEIAADKFRHNEKGLTYLMSSQNHLYFFDFRKILNK